jgi:hypothetical protein
MSCSPDYDDREPEPNPPPTIEGLYSDTASMYWYIGNYIDSVIIKNVYKVNDSIYWMPAYFCSDSTFSQNYCSGLGRKLFLKRLPGDIFKVIPDSSDPISYPFIAPYSFWDGQNYLFVHRNYGNPYNLKEIHRMRKL